MSFNSFGSGGFGSRGPFSDKPERPSYWKELLIATLPAFVASVMPIVVSHILSKDKPTPQKTTKPDEKPEEKKDKPEQV